MKATNRNIAGFSFQLRFKLKAEEIDKRQYDTKFYELCLDIHLYT